MFSEDLAAKVLDADVRRLVKGKRLLVGFSGGADSCTLLHMLASHSSDLGVWVVAAHINHGLRDTADEDQQHCQRICALLGVPFVSHRVDVESNPAVSAEGLESAARRLRYEALRNIQRDHSAHVLCVGHNADDQVESLLLHLVRGTGWHGVMGMDRLGDPLRPLLDIRRADTERYCQSLGLPYITDESNSDTRFSRNMLRLKVLPLLRQVNPGVERALLRFSDIARQEEIDWDLRIGPVFEQAAQRSNGMVILDWEQVREQTVAVQRRLISQLFDQFGGTEGVELRHIERLRQFAKQGRRGAVNLTSRRIVVRCDGKRLIARESTSCDIQPVVWEEPVDVSAAQYTDPNTGTIFHMVRERRQSPIRQVGNWRVSLNIDAIVEPLVFRVARAGERILPLGMKGRRKVFDVLSSAGVPSTWRRAWPVLADAEGVIWVPGGCIADRCKTPSGGCDCLVLEAEIQPEMQRILPPSRML